MNDAISELAGLADRVEKLEGPDREIDVLIAEAVGWEDGMGWTVAKYRAASPLNTTADLAAAPDRPGFHMKGLPAYTASLDAAMSLVDEPWEIGLMWDRDERKSFAAVGPNALTGFDLGSGECKSLDRMGAQARALTAAALRARAKQ